MDIAPAQSLATPRDVADKRRKEALVAAIRMALNIESSAVRHNTQTFNRNRYKATAAIPGYELLKDRARAIKENAISRLPELLRVLEESILRNGGKFFYARNAQEASRYVTEVCISGGARLVVKGKSMTSEEVQLNRFLEKAGIEVAETDLAEFILQVADEQPSHIIAPAIHYSRERITALFKRVFHTDVPLETGEELTAFARERLREKFLQAEVGISGANLIAADSGTLMLVESEGNIRMTSLVPPIHIAIAGIEKIVPSRAEFAPFLELLAASATGQLLSSYTSFIGPPLNSVPVLADGDAQKREFHLVLVDNGRMQMRDDPDLREGLFCIRCSACLNSCANFQTVGGHAFGGETYSGGIGGSWEAGTKGLTSARFSELCSGCSRCVPQCPVRIDIPWLNVVLRQRLNAQSKEPEEETKSRTKQSIPATAFSNETGVSLQKYFFGRYDLLGKWGSRAAFFSNAVSFFPPTRIFLEKIFGVDRRRHLPPFARTTLSKASKQMVAPQISKESAATSRALLFADIFSNYGSPERGLATLKVLRAMGADIVVSDVLPDGRAALSQGMIATAKRQAKTVANLLAKYLDEGREIIIVEPSVLSMFRFDYRHLLDDADGQKLFARLQGQTFDAMEYVVKLLQKQGLNPADVFPAKEHARGNRIFLHCHCQQKTCGAAAPTETLLRECGFDVLTSQVECCGMAGSFGYKKDFYELSMAVGQDLFQQIQAAESAEKPRTLVAVGISCQEQIQEGMGRRAIHPMELLAEIVRPTDT